MTPILAAAFLLAAYAAYCLWALRRALVGTVLMGPWAWCIAAVAAGLAVCMAESLGASPEFRVELRWLALVLSFSVFVARLGAKRPQQRAWHWVVFSFWVVAGLPAWQAMFLGRALVPSAARDGLVIALVVLQTLDCVGTRLLLPAVIAGAGQLLLHPIPRLWPNLASGDLTAVSAMLLGVLALSSAYRFLRTDRCATPGWRSLWPQLRDRIGVLWSLRIMQRFNWDAERMGEPIRLLWRGFVDTSESDGGYLNQLPPQLESAWRNLLRRFADQQWLDDRLPDGSPPAPSVVS